MNAIAINQLNPKKKRKRKPTYKLYKIIINEWQRLINQDHESNLSQCCHRRWGK